MDSGAVIELAVADQDSEAAGRDIIAVISRQAVDRAGETDPVLRPAPSRALDRSPQREAGIDVGKC
jgi:hypothetical protein